MSCPVARPILQTAREDFERQGFAVAEELFSREECTKLIEHFQKLHDDGVPGHYEVDVSPEEAAGDPLKAYPRMMNPHRFDALSRRYLVDPRVVAVLEAILGEEPIAAQTMVYFKSPGSRGQALHQDNFYLQVKPGTCVAAWTPLDDCDRENGALMVVPKTHEAPIDCSKLGQKGSYDGGPSIPVPEGYEVVTVDMAAGDVLFFNGSLIHGSGRNVSKTRWRRTFISHYAGASCESISKFYHPLINVRGEEVDRGVTTDGGPCGGFVGAAH